MEYSRLRHTRIVDILGWVTMGGVADARTREKLKRSEINVRGFYTTVP
jgi:hypothetical protein